MNITSSYTQSPPHQDGRTSVVEQHTLDDGRVFKYEYLCGVGVNPAYVAEERALVITKELAAREAAKQVVVGTSIPLTKHEFLSRFTQDERIAVRARAKTDARVMDFMEMLNASGGVFHALAVPGINYLSALGDITPERAGIIGAHW